MFTILSPNVITFFKHASMDDGFVMQTANFRKSDYVVLALCELFGFC